MKARLGERLRALALAAAAILALPAGAQTVEPATVDQGANWSDVERAVFYTRDQGSRLMPLPWLQALKHPDGQPFLKDLLARYGYLPNAGDKRGLPIGFAVSGPSGSQVVGMTCAACHTRQITVQGAPYRIDGGPALADFQGFLTDLDAAVGAVLKDDASFAAFAGAIRPVPLAPADLRADVEGWYARFHTLIGRALPAESPWGPGRLDALGMIFNRLTGLDLGPAESNGIIAENIRPADAPVRYPFLWNAAVQDHTQWPGIAGNGDDFLALARNLGEVYGVFGEFTPRPTSLPAFLNTDFLHGNSSSFEGLAELETLVRRIGAPRWPWALDKGLVARGQVIFKRSAEDGGCGGCHKIRTGIPRLGGRGTWRTPIVDVGTDSREYGGLRWTAKTGALQGALVPFAGAPLGETEPATQILRTAVLGTIMQHQIESLSPFSTSLRALAAARNTGAADLPLPPELKALAEAFAPPPAAPAMPAYRYEARVLQGIWAAAPYLHNGSVPSLAELLKRPADRVASFKVGPAYDTATVGLAAEQGAGASAFAATGCADRNSGNSNCGHDYGTGLAADEKQALLEYLKSL